MLHPAGKLPQGCAKSLSWRAAILSVNILFPTQETCSLVYKRTSVSEERLFSPHDTYSNEYEAIIEPLVSIKHLSTKIFCGIISHFLLSTFVSSCFYFFSFLPINIKTRPGRKYIFF